MIVLFTVKFNPTVPFDRCMPAPGKSCVLQLTPKIQEKITDFVSWKVFTVQSLAQCALEMSVMAFENCSSSLFIIIVYNLFVCHTAH